MESGLGEGGLNKVTEDARWLTLGEVRTGPGRKTLLDEEYFNEERILEGMMLSWA